MRWLPTFSLSEISMCDDEGEAEGPILTVEWLGWILEIAIARRERRP